MDEIEQCRAAASQTELDIFSDMSTSWRLSYPSDDDGYDVIVDESDDSDDAFHDTFATREVCQCKSECLICKMHFVKELARCELGTRRA